MPEIYRSETSEPAPTYAAWTADTLNQIINRRDPVHDLLDSLSGTIKDANGVVVRQGDPHMNNAGVDSVAKILKSVMNTNIILSELDDTDIMKLSRLFGEGIMFDLFTHYKSYSPIITVITLVEGKDGNTKEIYTKIKKDLDMADLDIIFTMCMTAVLASLKSARFAGTRNAIAPMYTKTETAMSKNEDQDKKKFPLSFGGGGT